MSRGDVLCILGDPWIVQDYYLFVGQLKRDLGVRCIPLIHDVIPTIMPEVCDGGVVDISNRALAGTLRYADAVLTISKCTADSYREVAGRFDLPSPHIAAVPVGGSVFYEEPGAAPSEGQVIDPIVGGKWHEPEPWSVWSSGRTAELVMSVERSVGASGVCGANHPSQAISARGERSSSAAQKQPALEPPWCAQRTPCIRC